MWPILAWARTPVAPVGGALAHCSIHDLTQPLVAHLLARTGLPAQAVDALLLGNALGANGNPARMVALAAGLPECVATVSIDSQCCAGMDAVTHACAWLALGQADIVIADPMISKSHAVFQLINGKLSLVDLNSTNGTIVNGGIIKKHEVAVGDLITLGGTIFKVLQLPCR